MNISDLPERTREHIVVSDDGCWLWQRALNRDGYGYLHMGNRRWMAHRGIYEILVGPIPNGLTLDHLCRVPSCVNPAHLEPVTQRENVLRGMRGRLKTHCSQGHEWTPENIYHAPKGGRGCRICRRDRVRIYYRARARREAS